MAVKKVNKGGRPKKIIDKTQFEDLCQLQCTEKEICGWFKTTNKTLDNWCKETYGTGFKDTYAEKRVGGTISLRRSQFRLAESNATMAIWLGKQYLGQTDAMKVEMHDVDEVATQIESVIYGTEQQEPESN